MFNFKYSRGGKLILILSMIILTITMCPNTVHANPLLISEMSDSALFNNGTFVCMPQADVEINITRKSSDILVNLTGLYQIYTNQTQNTTIAFVYPDLLLTSSDSVSEMVLTVNDTLTEYSTLSADEFDALGFSDDMSIYTALVANYACFNMSLIANTTSILKVVSNSRIPLTGANYWNYYYIFGSARSFSGDTSERIHIHLIEEVRFLDTRFSPDDYLSITESGLITDAVWEFNVSDMSSDLNQVHFSGHIRIANSNDLILSIIAIVLVVSLVFVFGYRKSRSS